MDGDKNYQANYKVFDYKTKNVEICLNNLFDFVTNQIFNITPDMKFGTVNPQRQQVFLQLFFNFIIFYYILLYYILLYFIIIIIKCHWHSF